MVNCALKSTKLLFATLLAVWLHLGLAQAGHVHRRAVDVTARDLNTNAQRLARGYPPLIPRNLYDASKTHVARHGKPSGQPEPDNKKCIKVVKQKRGNTEDVGYVNEDFIPGKGIFKVKDNKRDCLGVVVPRGDGPFDITIAGENSNWKWLGLASGENLKASYLVKTAQTSVGSKPQKVGNSASGSGLEYSESAVWKYDSGANRLSAIWKKNEGNQVDTVTYMVDSGDDAQKSLLYFATNPSFPNHVDNEYQVWLELVDA